MRYTPDNMASLGGMDVIVLGGFNSYAVQGPSYVICMHPHTGWPKPLRFVEQEISQFLLFAKGRPDQTFWVTKLRCVEAGFTYDQIGPMFAGATDNVVLPYEFQIAILDAHDPNDL